MEETTNKGRGLLKIVVVSGMIHVAMMALGRYMSKKAGELEQKNAGRTSKKYLACLNGKDIRISKEPVEKISIRSYLGGVNLDLTEACLEDEVEIQIRNVMGGVSIKVPPMVQVDLEGSCVMSGFANLVPSYEADDIPTIRIHADSVMGGVSVQMVP